jgi:hypothetical protein
VQGVHPDLRYVATLGNQQASQLYDEVAEIDKSDLLRVAFIIS